jgi:hypothetical protein
MKEDEEFYAVRKRMDRTAKKWNACRGGWSDAVPRSRGGL